MTYARYIASVLLLGWGCTGIAAPVTSPTDTAVFLLSNPAVRIDAVGALNDLYNFKFDKADQQFRWIKQKYPWHPLPYFLLGLSAWWRIMPNPANKTYDMAFIAYMDTSILAARNLYKKASAYKMEAAFFLAAAHGFKGRLYAESSRADWVKAAGEGKTALRYLEESKEGKDLSPELLFGDALYNYFSVWIPENYAALRPLLWFFRKGDKALGLAQLTEVSYNAFYTRTEAMIWLMRILSGYENKPDKALLIAEYLHQTYPDNSYFQRYYARTLYYKGRFSEAEVQALQVLHRIDSGQVGYTVNDGRYAAYYLGQICRLHRHTAQAKKYFLQVIQYANAVNDKDSWYYTDALLELGNIAQEERQPKQALIFFNEAKKRAASNSYVGKEARKKVRMLKKG